MARRGSHNGKHTAAAPERVQLDAIDRRLVDALIVDGRATYKRLSEVVGLSGAAVRVRVKRLLDTGAISIVGRVHASTLGYDLYAYLWVRLAVPYEQAAEELARYSGVATVTEISGRYDLAVEARLEDRLHLSGVRDAILAAGIASSIESSWILGFDKQDWTGVGNRVPKAAVAPVAVDPDSIDEIDRQLALALTRDGRLTYAALAEMVGLSQPSARERVVSLLERKVVTINAQLSSIASGLAGFVGLYLGVTGPIDPVAEALVAMAETTIVARALGPYDLLVEVWYDDEIHLQEVFSGVRSIPGIREIETVPYISRVDSYVGGRPAV